MIDRRAALGGLAGILSIASPRISLAQSAPLTARDIFAGIKRASGQKWDPNPTDDRIIFGDRNVPVTGIATCFLATLDILKAAHAAGLNYVIPHEATFYERYDDLAQSTVRDNDRVLSGKEHFITASRMVIQRMHSHAHRRPGDAIMVGLVRQLGWEGQRLADQEGRPVIALPRTAAIEVGRHIKTRLGRRTLRMFGDPARPISTISISAGMPGENAQIQQLEAGTDAVLLGEVREPEVLGYAQDMAATRPITIYLSGHFNEDAGMGVVADWLKTVFPQLPVRHLSGTDPYTNPA